MMLGHPAGRPWQHAFPRSFSAPYAAALTGSFRIERDQGDYILGLVTNFDLTGFSIAGLPQFAAPIDIPAGVFVPLLFAIVPGRLYSFTATAYGGTVGGSTQIVTLLLGK